MTDEPEKPESSEEAAPTSAPESADAGTLPPPPDADQPRPTPESQAALTGKAPSGSSITGTTMPADSTSGASSPKAQAPAARASNEPPPGETPEEKKARLARVIAEAKAKNAAKKAEADAQASAGTEAPAASTPSGATPPTPGGDRIAQAHSADEPPGGKTPAIADPSKNPSQADLEKAAKIADAKARAAALKEAAVSKASAAASGSPAASGAVAAGAPKAPVKKKDEGPKPVDASTHPLVRRLREKLEGAVEEASTFLGQLSIRVTAARIVEICRTLRDDRETPFNYLSDVTCVHFPDRPDAPFEMVYNLYSIKANERVRLKAATSDAEPIESVTGVWPAANWMEREVYDLFGVRFKNHPDLRRILLPLDWEGHPLRKEYPLHAVENNWTAKHLPEFSGVQKEQLEQRRAYGLEILSVPDERRIRDIFRDGREPLSLDRKG